MTRLEDRTTPSSVANVLANNPATDTTFQRTQSETASLVFGSTVLVAFNDSGSNIISSKRLTGYARSTDGGANFQDMGVLPGDNDAGDPVFARDAVSGRVYLATLSFFDQFVPFSGTATQVFRSDDGGQTFQNPVNAMANGSFNAGDLLDKEWIAVDNFGTSAQGQGNIYVVTRQFINFNNPGAIFFNRSTDSGTTWGVPQMIVSTSASQTGPQGAFVTVSPNHTVSVFWFDNGTSPSRILMRQSNDLGQTFGATTTVANLAGTGIPNGDLGLGFRSSQFPQVAVNPVTGAMYCVYPDKGSGSDRCDIRFTTSTNGGATWSTPVRVNNDVGTKDQWQPTVAVTPDGTRVTVSWYDRRNDPDNQLIDYFAAPGTVDPTTGAVTFVRNFRITNTSFGPIVGGDPFINPTYMGDYDVASADNANFYYFWADNRLGNADVRSARVPVGSTGPQITGTVPSGPNSTSVNAIDLFFDQPMDTNSFALGNLINFSGPAGNLIPFVTGFNWVSNTNLRLTFSTQSIPGAYSIALGPQIRSATGSLLDNNLNGTAGESPADNDSSTFVLGAGPTYVASAATFDASLNLSPSAPGVVTLNNISNVDDDFESVPLGQNSFRYYGVNYTGSNQLFVSSNGLISFARGDATFTNTDLSAGPGEPLIAPLWTDYVTNVNSTTNDLVLYQFQDLDADGTPDRLVINWRNVHYVRSVIENGITFEAVLMLNTGLNSGDIIFNYVDLTNGQNAPNLNNGASATVGIKAVTSFPQDRTLVSFSSAATSGSLFGQGKALRMHRNQAPTAAANGPYLVALNGTVPLSSAGTSDPEQLAASLTYLWDLNGNGTFGETGVNATRGDEVGTTPTFNAAGLTPGNYTVALRAFDSGGLVGNATTTVTVVAPPAVVAVQVNDGSAQRSMVTKLVVTFNKVVSFVGGPANAFALTDENGVAVPGVTLGVAIDNTSGRTVATITFLNPAVFDASLADGRYVLRTLASRVQDALGQHPTIDATFGFFRLFGDLNGDGHVDENDFVLTDPGTILVG